MRTYCFRKLQPLLYTLDECIIGSGHSFVPPYYNVIEGALCLEDLDWLFHLGFIMGVIVVGLLGRR